MYVLYVHSNALGVRCNCASSFYWHDRWSSAYPCQKVFPVELHISAAGKKIFGRSGRVSYSIRLLRMKITVNHNQSVTRVTKNPAQWTFLPLKVNLYPMAQRSWGSQADLIWFVFRLSLHHQGIGPPSLSQRVAENDLLASPCATLDYLVLHNSAGKSRALPFLLICRRGPPTPPKFRRKTKELKNEIVQKNLI